jgi:hypothetical protein
MRTPLALGLALVLAGGCGSSATTTDGPSGDGRQTDSFTDHGEWGPEDAQRDAGGADVGGEDSLPADGAQTDGAPPSDSGTDGPVACQWSATDPCGAGHYCNATDCGTGVCEPVGTTEQDARSPVCGCDGLTYWNASVAAAHGMAAKGSGQCNPSESCGGFAGIPCPTGARCNYHLSSQASCGIADQTGTCWVVPATCPSIMIGPTTRQCSAATCTGECELIKAGVMWYVDNTCPV